MSRNTFLSCTSVHFMFCAPHTLPCFSVMFFYLLYHFPLGYLGKCQVQRCQWSQTKGFCTPPTRHYYFLFICISIDDLLPNNNDDIVLTKTILRNMNIEVIRQVGKIISVYIINNSSLHKNSERDGSCVVSLKFAMESLRTQRQRLPKKLCDLCLVI